MKLGPTGKFPDGKISPNNDGEIAIAIGVHEDCVIIDLGPKGWIGLPPAHAIELGTTLLKKAWTILQVQAVPQNGASPIDE